MAEQRAVTGRPVEAPGGFLRRYVFSVDHRTIGIQYYLLALFAVLIGVALSLVIRLHLAWPQIRIPLLARLSPAGAPGGMVTPEYYLSLVTLHGTLMIFFVLTVAPQSAFGNLFLPLEIGAREMAFPRLNMLSFWMTAAALAVLVSTLFIADGPPLAGWTAYPPLSALGSVAGPGEGSGQTFWIASIMLFCFGSLLGSINFISTCMDRRAPGMTLARLPLTCWAWFVTAIMVLLSFSVLFAACLLLLLDRSAGTSFFVPAGLVVSDRLIRHRGGSPLLWQHLFWFFGHPEVYIAILPGMGLTSHLLSTFARKPVFAYRAMAGSTVAIGLLGFALWGHHMFVSGMSPYSAFAFSAMTMAIAVPSSLKTFNWLATLWGGRIRFTSACLFALGFVSVLVTGGLSGLFLAQPPLDLYLHDSYFVVAHFHIVMGVAGIFGVFAGTYFWFPKVCGRMMNEPLGRIHFWITLIGVYALFVPMHFVGLEGNPRRFASLTGVNFLRPLVSIHQAMTLAAFVTGAGQLIFLFNLLWSMFKGAPSTVNPWEATTLEWAQPQIVSGERESEPPLVFRGPYEFNLQGQGEFVMQNVRPENV